MAEIFRNEVNVQDNDGNDVVRLNADLGNIAAGGFDKDGDLRLFDSQTPIGDPADAIIVLDADNAHGRFGGNGKNGEIVLRAEDGNDAVTIDGRNANIFLGGFGRDGELHLMASSTNAHTDASQASISLSGDSGDIILRAEDGNDAVTIDGRNANIFLGGRGRDGDIHLMASSTNAHTDASQASVSISGDSGDIILLNADCAEEFSVAVKAEPGTVMALGADGLLRPSVRPYDKTAVGVVSGAGGYKPGIILDHKSEQRNRSPIALVGKVCCKVTAAAGSIETGDMLTTSNLPGHAMKATDPSRAFGAVIGKALAPHTEGEGLIPMLIALQ